MMSIHRLVLTFGIYVHTMPMPNLEKNLFHQRSFFVLLDLPVKVPARQTQVALTTQHLFSVLMLGRQHG